MTATDELRRLLDERGVEWRDDSSIYGTRRTVWTADGVTYVAAEVSGRLKVSGYLTPEQAVEATLGSDLKAENAKLRELVRDMWQFTGAACKKYPRLFDQSAQGGQMVMLNMLDSFEQRMRELGVDA